MLRPKTIPYKDSNLAGLGSAMDKASRESAAGEEVAWDKAGKAPGLQVWRVEQFKLKEWPAEEHGTFFAGDAYIVLHTKEGAGGALSWDVHFWLGADCSQDEAGVAAYKAVELDDALGGAAVQHREVMGHESPLFSSYFPHLKLLEGGAASGFRHVKPKDYVPRLLRVIQHKGKGRVQVVMRQVPMENGAVNSGDVYILDQGLEVMQWQGEECGVFEKRKASEVVRAFDDERGGRVHITVLEGYEENPEFHGALGGTRADVKTKQEAEEIDALDAGAGPEGAPAAVMFKVSDESGSLSFDEVHARPLSMFEPGDVMVVDAGYEVYVWVGNATSRAERLAAIPSAQQYLGSPRAKGRPAGLPITRVLEGAEGESFKSFMAQFG